jgi:CIC family chloride channel protein
MTQTAPVETHRLSRTLHDWLRRLPERWRTADAHILVALGLIVGVGSGLGAVVFRWLIDSFTAFFFGTVRGALEPTLGAAAVIPLPALGGLIYGPLIYIFAREAKGHGVPEVMLAVAQRGGRIRPVVAVVKALASALCIGSGGSVGREGPIVQIGSALGSSLGQLLRLSDAKMRTLVACGAAGGIAATFNAPIAGVFFALEVILGEFTTRAFGIVVIASVTAAVIGRAFLGNVPAFQLPAYDLVSLGEFGLYALLGVVAGVTGVIFSRTLYWFEDRFDDIRMPEYLKPLPAGLILGTLGLFLPQVFGIGYPAMEQALTGQYALNLLIILVFAKVIAVSITIGGGGSGGVFAPALFIGSMLGTAFGTAAGALFPGGVAAPGAYGLVGMAAVFTGAARAPITAVIILFELTDDYRIILPLMVAVVISTLVSEGLSPVTIYTLKLRRRGIDLHAGPDVDVMRATPVSAAMTTDIPTLSPDTTVTEAGEHLDAMHGRSLLVLDSAGQIDGIVTLGDLAQAMLANRPGATLADVASRPVVTVFADESLTEAVSDIGVRDFGQVPVVTRADPMRAVGLLRRDDIVRAYSRALMGRLQGQTAQPIQFSDLRGRQLVEVDVPEHSGLVGRAVAELHLPESALVVAIDRGEATIVPSSDTVVEVGDRAVILVPDRSVTDLHEYLASLPRRAAA